MDPGGVQGDFWTGERIPYSYDSSENRAGFPESNASRADEPRLQTRNHERLLMMDETNWQHLDNPSNFQQMLVQQYHFSPSVVDGVRSITSSKVWDDTSSMALTAQSRDASLSLVGSSYAPSLDFTSSSSAVSSTGLTRSSKRTSNRGSSINVYGLDPPDDGVLEVPGGLQCLYYFLNCTEKFHTLEEWDTHCKAHCRPFRILDCPFSDCHWTVEQTDGEAAWEERLTHCRSHHRHNDVVDQRRRPPSRLIDHLFREKVIDTAQKKELTLKGRLTGQTFIRTADPRRERRERNQMQTAGPSIPITRNW